MVVLATLTLVLFELLPVPCVCLTSVGREEMLVLAVGLSLDGPPEADLLPQLLQGGQVGVGPGADVRPILGAQDDD